MFGTLNSTASAGDFEVLRRHFRREWEQVHEERVERPTGRGTTGSQIRLLCCPIGVLQDRLLILLAEAPERSAMELRPVIRQMIADRDFSGDSGEPMDPHHDWLIDRYAEAVTRVLERVRQRALQAGLWCGEAPAPQMFG